MLDILEPGKENAYMKEPGVLVEKNKTIISLLTVIFGWVYVLLIISLGFGSKAHI